MRNTSSSNPCLALARAAVVATALLALAGGAGAGSTDVAPPAPSASASMAAATPVLPAPDVAVPIQSLAAALQVGDLVFIRVAARPFREVAAATGSWTNHVGVVVDTAQAEPVVAESTFPVSRRSTLSRFVARSEHGQVAVRRLASGLTAEQSLRVGEAAQRRLGIFYDTGFNLHSSRQFCSRFVREVMAEATGQTLGEIQTFAQLLAQRPDAPQGFWRLWYFGRIPWERETVTPASVLQSPALRAVFEGVVAPVAARVMPQV